MAIAANPPPQSKLPAKLFEDEDLRVYFGTLQEDMYRLWLRSGGGKDQVSEIVIDLDAINDRLDAIELRLTAIEAELIVLAARIAYLEGTMIVTAVDVTAAGNTTIICTAALTVTLAADPLDKDLVKVKQTNGSVTISGNSKNIDGDSSVIMRRNFTGLDMVYSSTADAWFIV